MVKDINTNGNNSSPHDFVQVGDSLFFTATDRMDGDGSRLGLWKTDGTSSGTMLVKDFPNAGDSTLNNLTAVGGTLFFTASGDLWQSDGTDAGTLEVKQILSSNLVAFGNVVYFSGSLSFGNTDNELWRSDGTVTGTYLVKDINPGTYPHQANPSDFTVVGNTLFFTADDGMHGRELWKTDGTEAGTVLVKDINPGATATTFTSLTGVGTTLYFFADDGVHGREIWKSDGTDAGTVLMDDLTPGSASSGIYEMTAFGNLLVFFFQDPTVGAELWKSDGTAAGTVFVKDIEPGSEAGSPYDLTVVGNAFYFCSWDLAHGIEVWKSDGTNAGTMLIKDVYPGDYPGPYDPTPRDLTVVGNDLYYIDSYSDLWKTDGTDAGTSLVSTLYAADTNTLPSNLHALGDTLVFAADDPVAGFEPWETDGTAAGTQMLKDINPGTESSQVDDLTVMGDAVYFSADSTYRSSDSNLHGYDLWRTDGTAAGTVVAAPFGVSPYELFPPQQLTAVGNTLFFTHNLGFVDSLYKTDGTPTGTVDVKDISASALFAMGNTLLFVDSDSGAIWKSDGTTAGTVLVKDIWPNSLGDDVFGFTQVGNKVYFAAESGTNDDELWVTDGTTAGTYRVKDINPGTHGSFPFDLTAVGDELYFAANDGVHGTELWKSDGTDAGTVMVTDIAAGSTSSNPRELVAAGNTLFFFAGPSFTGASLYESDGTAGGTVPLKALTPESDFTWPEDYPKTFATIGDTVYFGAYGSGGVELWKSDGTIDGTALVKDINPGGSQWSWPSNFAVIGPLLYFVADDGVHGRELWKSDGTSSGTVLVSDIWPGSDPTSKTAAPSSLIAFDGQLLFSADDGVHGTELWTVTSPTVTGVGPVIPNPRNTPIESVDITFSEPIDMTTFSATNVSLTRNKGVIVLGGLTISLLSGSTYRVDGLGDATSQEGDYALTVDADGIVDASGDVGRGSMTTNWVTDTTPPAITAIAAITPNPRNAPVPSVDVTFSETIDPNTLTSGNLSLTRDGTFVPVAGAVTVSLVSGSTYLVSGLSNSTEQDGSYSLTVNAAGVKDLAGNTGSGALSTGWVMDTVSPTASITAVTPNPRNTAVSSLAITFSEAVSGVNLADLKLIRGSGSNLLTGSQTLTTSDNITYTLGNLSSLTATQGNYVLTLTTAGSRITDAAGNALAGNASTSWTVDTTAPTASITAVTPNPRNTAVSTMTIHFSEAVSGFGLADLSLTRNSGGNLLTSSQTLTTSDHVTYTLGNLGGLTAAQGSYVLTLTVSGSGIADAAGNALAGNATTSWAVDTTAPTASIAAVSPNPRSTVVSSLSITFSEAVSGFDLADLSLSNNGGSDLMGSCAVAHDHRSHHLHAAQSLEPDRLPGQLRPDAGGIGLRDSRRRRQRPGGQRDHLLGGRHHGADGLHRRRLAQPAQYGRLLALHHL